MFLWRKKIYFNEQLSLNEQREMVSAKIYEHPDQNTRKLLGSLDEIYQEIMISNFKDNPDLVFVNVVVKLKELYQGYPQDMYIGKFVSFLSTVPAGHPASGKATDLLNRMFVGQKEIGNNFFSSGFMDLNKRWKYYLCGHKNPDLDTLIAVLLKHYVALQAPDYRHGRGVAAVLGDIAPYDKAFFDRLLDVSGFADAYYTQVETLKRKVDDVYTPAQECLTVRPDDSIQMVIDIFRGMPPSYKLLPVVYENREEYLFGIYERWLLIYVSDHNIEHLQVQDFMNWCRQQGQDFSELFVEPNQFYDDIDLKKRLKDWNILPVVDMSTRRFCGVVSEGQLQANTRKIFALDADLSEIPGASELDLDAGGVTNHHKQTVSALYGQNLPVGSTVSIVLNEYAANDWVIFPPRVLLLGLAAMIDDTDGWLAEKVTEFDKAIFRNILQRIPAEFTQQIGEDDSNRMAKVIAHLKDEMAAAKQAFYRECFAQGKFEKTGFLRDEKTIGDIPITQVKLNAENDSSFNKYEKFVFKYTDDLARQGVDLNIFMKTYYKSETDDSSQHYDEVLITSANEKKLEFAVKFLREEIKGFEGQDLKPIPLPLSGHEHTVILRYPAGTVFSRKMQFPEKIMKELSGKLEEFLVD
jgi:hypothetical protein